MDEKPSPEKKTKRRLRAGPETVRSRLEQNTLATAAKPEEKVKPEGKKRHKIFAPFRVIWRPIRWLARYLIPRYFRTAAHELRLTTWPSRKQSRQLTLAVVIFAVVFGVFVYVLDLGLDKLFKEIFVK
ncbi:MAG TPA: preprotein translocase subunit SecE [Candidatus Binatia bacterium]|jgi:preprotein translocase SecE subunit|nr:preprotein translocase subunit SecE [Candidatus Binatia bacterium]